VEAVFPETRHNLEANIRRFAEVEILYHQSVQQHKKRLMKAAGEEVHIPVLLLRKTQPLRTILFEIIQAYGFSAAQVEECLKLMDSSNGKYISSHSHRIIKNRAWLIIAPLQDKDTTRFIIEKEDQRVSLPDGELIFKTVTTIGQAEAEKNPGTAFLDADKIGFPLILRKWKAGDYFYPLGMTKKKKIARFLTDAKLSKTAKEKIRVLEMDQRIIWIVGHRVDNRFCINPGTKRILKIEMRML
jgi:tRNA(Ile)-lysidine synthase